MRQQQVTAMRKGRERALRARRTDAVKRVRRYRQWLASGCGKGIPEIPSSADYRLAGLR